MGWKGWEGIVIEGIVTNRREGKGRDGKGMG